MPKAFFSTKAGSRAIFKLGRWGQNAGSPAQQVHDGDTINVQTDATRTNFAVRLLGIDTPEISFQLPNSKGKGFSSTDDAGWQEFLTDPFAKTKPFLGRNLQKHLHERVGQGVAENHHYHAEQAEDVLEELIKQDMAALSQDKDSFSFFLAFASEVMDGFGRLLCFINRNQPDPKSPECRPLSYNERELECGVASPYFIWPNVNPFRRKTALVDAVPEPTDIPTIAQSAALGCARQFVRDARVNQRGVFEAACPLRLEPFELRFLARRRPPSRWVIDLTSTSNMLLQPENYYTIPNSENRLFVPPEYVPLFVEKGWRRQ